MTCASAAASKLDQMDGDGEGEARQGEARRGEQVVCESKENTSVVPIAIDYRMERDF